MQQKALCGRPKLFFRVDRTNSEASNGYGPSVFSLSHRNRLLHMLCGWAIWRTEKKESMEQLAVAPSTVAQLLRRGAGDASDGALHIISLTVWSMCRLCHRQSRDDDVDIGVDEDSLRPETDDMVCQEALFPQTESFDHPLPSTEARMSYEHVISS